MCSTSLPNMCPEIFGDPLLNPIKPPEKLIYHLQKVPRATTYSKGKGGAMRLPLARPEALCSAGRTEPCEKY